MNGVPLIRWSVWTESQSSAGARRTLRRALRRAPGMVPEGLTVAPYPKTDGHVLRFTTTSGATRWADLVLEALQLGDALGYRWALSGAAPTDLAGWTNHAWVEGVVSISWEIERGPLP